MVKKDKDESSKDATQGGKGKKGWFGRMAEHPLGGGLLSEISKVVRDSKYWAQFMASTNPAAVLIKKIAANRLGRMALNSAIEALERFNIPGNITKELQTLVEYAGSEEVPATATPEQKKVEPAISAKQLASSLGKLKEGETVQDFSDWLDSLSEEEMSTTATMAVLEALIELEPGMRSAFLQILKKLQEAGQQLGLSIPQDPFADLRSAMGSREWM